MIRKEEDARGTGTKVQINGRRYRRREGIAFNPRNPCRKSNSDIVEF
jgi:hypothetical protein